MKYEQWKKILGEINLEKDLSFNNVVEKIQEKLAAEDKAACEVWEQNNCDLNFRFSVHHSSRNTVHKETLFCLATHNYLHKVERALLQRAFTMGPTKPSPYMEVTVLGESSDTLSDTPAQKKSAGIDDTTKPSSNMEVTALGESRETMTRV